MQIRVKLLFTALLTVLLGGCGVVFGMSALLGQGVVLLVALGIFVGTLSLGRTGSGGTRSGSGTVSSSQGNLS